MIIREASELDLSDVLLVEKEAFGYDKESNFDSQEYICQS